MKKPEKDKLVAELQEKIKGANALYYTDFTGLNVKRMTDLRRRLRKANVEYVVIKNLEFLREGGSEKHVRDIRGILAGIDVDRALVERGGSDVG